MIRIEVNQSVAAPAQLVFDVLLDPPAYQRADGNHALRAQWENGNGPEIGARWVEYPKLYGFPITARFEIKELDRSARRVLIETVSVVGARQQRTVNEAQHCCEICLWCEFTVPIPLVGKFIERYILAPYARNGFQTEMGRVQRVAESHYKKIILE